MENSSSEIRLNLSDRDTTQRLGIALGETLPEGSVLLLSGELGAGKTILTQGIGIGLGILEAIVSPTFTLLVEYDNGRIPLYHFDLYRLELRDVAQLQPELYWEGIEFEPGITVIEWAERLPYLPPEFISINLQYGLESDRVADLQATPGLALSLSTALDRFTA